jgi:hypothetical protein
MDDTLKSKILKLLNQHRLMVIATNRPRWLAASYHCRIRERWPDDLFPVQSSKPKSSEPRAG